MSYNRFLETMLTWATFNKSGTRRKDHSPWMYTPAADTIFTVARERVYKQTVTAKEKQSNQPGASRSSADKGKGRAAPGGLDENGIPLDLDEADWGAEEEQILREMEDAELGTARETEPKPRRSRWLPKNVEPVLEEQPKWALLQQVLNEIEQHMYWGPDTGGEFARCCSNLPSIS